MKKQAKCQKKYFFLKCRIFENYYFTLYPTPKNNFIMKLLLLFTGILLLAAYGDYGKIDYAYWGAILILGSVVMASWNPAVGEGEESESELECDSSVTEQSI